MTVDQPVSGNAISIKLPNDLFALRAEASVFSPERIQRELANIPEATHLEVDENEINNEDVEEVITRRGCGFPTSTLCYAWVTTYPQLTCGTISTAI